MRRIKFEKFTPHETGVKVVEGKFSSGTTESKHGYFHKWSIESERVVAIVEERITGDVFLIPAGKIVFLDIPVDKWDDIIDANKDA